MTMKQTIALAAAAALIASGGAGWSAYGSASGHPSGARQPTTGALTAQDAAPDAMPRRDAEDEERHLTIRFHANEVTPNTFIDLGEQGQSAGDEIIENETLIQHGHVIGRNAIQGTLINPTHTSNFLVQAVVTWRLPAGQVTAQGAFTFDSIELAITGGTGAYQGASGTARVLGTDNPLNDVDVLNLVLPRR
jgi:hypothetical protein